MIGNPQLMAERERLQWLNDLRRSLETQLADVKSQISMQRQYVEDLGGR